MGALTEQEIFSRMSQSLRLTAELCDELAVNPVSGPAYRKLRENLLLIEGCCRQASAWREDTRWLNFGLQMGKIHQMSGDWLRGYRTRPDLPRVKLAQQHRHPLFSKLAENLRGILALADRVKNDRTGVKGMILPAPMVDRNAAVHRRQHTVQNLPVGMIRSDSGLIIPQGAAA